MSKRSTAVLGVGAGDAKKPVIQFVGPRPVQRKQVAERLAPPCLEIPDDFGEGQDSSEPLLRRDERATFRRGCAPDKDGSGNRNLLLADIDTEVGALRGGGKEGREGRLVVVIELMGLGQHEVPVVLILDLALKLGDIDLPRIFVPQREIKCGACLCPCDANRRASEIFERRTRVGRPDSDKLLGKDAEDSGQILAAGRRRIRLFEETSQLAGL